MSGIAVVFHRDGSPVLPEQVARMTDVIAHRGPDGIAYWTSGSIGLGHCALHTLPEDVGQVQPLSSRDGQLHLTFDGRIDNRDELCPLLNVPLEASDAAVTLAAYEQWGEYCPERLLGDFAFALWDDRDQKLFCARDIIGVKPLLYFVNDRVFLAGSERRQLFAQPGPTYAPDEQVIAALMMTKWISQEQTIHRDIKRLAPATAMTVRRDSISFRRYWDIHDISKQRRDSPEDLRLEFWDLLQKATGARLRSRRHAGVLLSGGLDSTAVATAACPVEKTNGPLQAFSMTFPDWPEADETKFIDSTVSHLRLAPRTFAPYQRAAGAYESDVESYRDLPDYYNDAFWDVLRTQARDEGVHVLLTGAGGDEWFAGSDFCLADHLRHGDVPSSWKTIRDISQRRQLSRFSALWRYGLKPLLPPAGFALARRLPTVTQLPAWMNQDFADEIGLARLIQPPPISKRPVRAHHPVLTLYESGSLAHTSEYHERLNSRFAIETRHPFHDRRLIEFGLSLPASQLRAGNETKVLLRASGRGKMPEAVRTRSGKANFSRQMALELERHAGPGFFETSVLAERGWVRLPELRRIFDETLARSTQPGYRIQISIWHVFALELLARSGWISGGAINGRSNESQGRA